MRDQRENERDRREQRRSGFAYELAEEEETRFTNS